MDSVKFLRRLRRPIISLVVSQGLLVAGLAWSQAEQDEGAIALLDAFVAEVHDLSAGFEQHRFDETGEPVEEPSTGRFDLLRGDCSCFRWHYDAPDEYIVVADGDWIWRYDVLLEQVDQGPATDLPASSAILLNGAGALRDNYAIAELPPAGGTRWLELTPLDPSASGFVTARLGFTDDVPVVIELVDGLNELTRLVFEDIEVNTGLGADVFEFEPPPGVTVLGPDDD